MRGEVEEAYRQHGPSVFRFLYRMTDDRSLAEDALQDTFQRLLERPPRRDENLRGWLFRVAANRLRDLQRKRVRRSRALERVGGLRTHSDPEDSPERKASRREAVAKARTMLARLPERDRTILLLREEGFTHREIAETLGTTTGSVGTMIARALDRAAEAWETTETTA